MGKLTHGKVRALTVPGRYGDGGTLHLVVSPRGTKSWVQRISIDGRRHDLGPGGWPVVSLAMARDRAFANRRAVAEGRGPLAERRKAKMPSFEHAVERVIAIHGEAWKDGGKTASHWRSTLREYAFPLIGEKPVDHSRRAAEGRSSMSTTFRPYLPEQSLLLPPDVREWLPEGHLAHHVSDLVDGLDLTAFYAPYEGDGRRNAPYDPRMMVKVLLYGYATAVFSSRRIARKLEEDVGFRMLAAGNFRSIGRCASSVVGI